MNPSPKAHCYAELQITVGHDTILCSLIDPMGAIYSRSFCSFFDKCRMYPTTRDVRYLVIRQLT